MHDKQVKEKIEHGADKMIKWIGSSSSLVVHTIFFIVMLALAFSGIGFERVMLVLTTIVSLEAIYLSIFIQITINRHTKELEEVSEDIEEIHEDVEEIQKDVDDIQENVEEIQEDVDEIQKDVDDIQENVEEIQEDVEEITEEETKSEIKKAKASKTAK